jgi:transposase
MSIKSVVEEKPERLKRKRYSEEFQREAVRLLEAGRPVAQLSRELGVSVWNLGQWRLRQGAGVPHSPMHHSKEVGLEGAQTVSLALELARTKAELATVTKQREILKKALSILGQEFPNAMP